MNRRTIPNSERFVLGIQNLSPLTLALCPDLPEQVFRIYDLAELEFVPHDAPTDAVRAAAVLEALRTRGRGREY